MEPQKAPGALVSSRVSSAVGIKSQHKTIMKKYEGWLSGYTRSACEQVPALFSPILGKFIKCEDKNKYGEFLRARDHVAELLAPQPRKLLRQGIWWEVQLTRPYTKSNPSGHLSYIVHAPSQNHALSLFTHHLIMLQASQRSLSERADSSLLKSIGAYWFIVLWKKDQAYSSSR